MIVETGEATAKAIHNTGATAKNLQHNRPLIFILIDQIFIIDSQQTP